MALHLEEVLGQDFSSPIFIIYLHLAVGIFVILVPPTFTSIDFHERPLVHRLGALLTE